MTIINSTHHFIFIHVPKTGGTSVKEYLRAYRGQTDLHVNRPTDVGPAALLNGMAIKKHSSASQIRRALGPAEFDRFFKFCVVRNPFVRAMSLFRFLKFNFRSWPNAEVMETIDTLADFVVAPIFRTAGPGGIIRPQVNWLSNRSGETYLDFIARVEAIESDFHKIRCRIGLPESEIPLKRRNASRGDVELFAAELNSGIVVDAIRARYAADFAFLHYSTDPVSAVDGDAMATG
jgi:hypothetical protein